jgi:16S rRNA G527 N7-methylase RsmG
LQRVVTALQLNNCQPHCRTAEEIAQHLPSHEAFDVVVSRGVGSIAHLMRLTRRLVTADGYLLLRKPLDTPELQDAKRLCTAGEWHHLAMVPLPWSTPPPWALISIQRCC